VAVCHSLGALSRGLRLSDQTPFRTRYLFLVPILGLPSHAACYPALDQPFAREAVILWRFYSDFELSQKYCFCDVVQVSQLCHSLPSKGLTPLRNAPSSVPFVESHGRRFCGMDVELSFHVRLSLLTSYLGRTVSASFEESSRRQSWTSCCS
jgi:hypothetical protein